jgi:glycosyltransferase involved in cell wall biosynthesis
VPCRAAALQHPDTVDVSVILLTYNHERFLVQAIESVLAQRTRAPFELLISEDCSTDRSREIIHRFVTRHPDRLRVFLSERNLNSNECTLRALRAARGRYLAFLDGDDYWTSNDKLQRQVDFLDMHQQCTMCFHNAMVVRDDGSTLKREITATNLPTITELPNLLRDNYIAGCSAMIRRDVLQDIPAWYEHAPFGDWPLYVFAAQRGSIGFLPAIMGAYRVHDKGLWSSTTRDRQIQAIIQFYKSISSHLGLSYRPQVLPILARHYFALGVLKKDAGKYAEAVEYLVTSVRLRPFTSEIRRGRRAWHLARLAICGLLGLGMTPREVASAVFRSARSTLTL